MGSGCCGGMMGPTMMGFGWLVTVLWLLVAVGILLLVIWGIRQVGVLARNPAEPPLVALQRRYARGEIGPGEYERVRADLRRGGENR